MKMSDAMAICYGGQPQLEPLVQWEREREAVKKVTITPEDFDKAMDGRWSPRTCPLSQCAIRNNLRRPNGDPDTGRIMAASEAARKIAAIFDQERGVHQRAQSPRLSWLRESLPVTIELS